MRPIARILADAADRLSPITDTPRLDADLLLAHALGMSRAKLLASMADSIDEAPFTALLKRRLAAEPIAYILREKEFFGLPFSLRPPLLIPRPETEHLVETALKHLQRGGEARALDLCTGTGCVAIAIAKNAPKAHLSATDIHPTAIQTAQENALRNNVRLSLHQGDLFAALPQQTPPFDVITANPPYVEDRDWPTLAPDIRDYEDPAALLAGPDGLDLIRPIIARAPRHLQPGGLLALEIGERQWEAVSSLLQAEGFTHVGFQRDLAGIRRIARGTKPRS